MYSKKWTEVKTMLFYIFLNISTLKTLKQLDITARKCRSGSRKLRTVC